MPGYLLIESRDPFESTGAARTYELAMQLRAAGHDVALFLVQNGVLAVRSGAHRAELDKVIGTQIEVLADDFSLRERGILSASLIGGVRVGADRLGRRANDGGLERPLALTPDTVEAIMTSKHTLTFVLHGRAVRERRTTTAFRLLHAALTAAMT